MCFLAHIFVREDSHIHIVGRRCVGRSRVERLLIAVLVLDLLVAFRFGRLEEELEILLPFYLVRPVGSGELAFGDILCMTGLKRSAAGCVGFRLSSLFGGAFDTLLPESNCLDLFTDLGYDNMRLLWMVWRSLWFVVA